MLEQDNKIVVDIFAIIFLVAFLYFYWIMYKINKDE